jgi:protein SCO1/2
MKQRLLSILASLLLLASLGACAPEPVKFKNTDITGSALNPDFSLMDPAGKPVSLASFKGQVVVVFFGFTQCPDVCPTTLQTLTQVMERLGDKQEKVSVVFITLDPERDTPEVLAQYLPQFNKRFVGLTGSKEALAEAAKGYRVFSQRVDGKTASSYTFDHTASSYVIDTKGVLRLLVRHAAEVADVQSDIALLLQGK